MPPKATDDGSRPKRGTISLWAGEETVSRLERCRQLMLLDTMSPRGVTQTEAIRRAVRCLLLQLLLKCMAAYPTSLAYHEEYAALFAENNHDLHDLPHPAAIPVIKPADLCVRETPTAPKRRPKK
jgi:hypothetical protein